MPVNQSGLSVGSFAFAMLTPPQVGKLQKAYFCIEMTMKLFVDTNIPLHHQPLDHIDWKAVTGAADVTLIFPVVVFDELDKHTNTPKLAARAKRVRKEVVGFIDTGIVKGDVRADSINKPHTKILDQCGLDPGQNDNWILGAIKDYMKNNPSENVAVLTSDFGMRIRAKSLDIPVIMLDEKYKIEAESEEEKEIKKLKAEIEKYKTAVPKLAVVFEDGKTAISFELIEPDFATYLQSAVWKMKNVEYPRVSEDEIYSYRLSQEYTQRDAAVYNGQLEDYYRAYEKYLLERRALYLAEGLTKKIAPVLKNSGSVQAKNIDVELFFPANVSVSEKEPHYRIPEPNMPYPPILGHLAKMSYSYENRFPNPRPVPDILPKVTENKDGTTKVEYVIPILKQQREIALPPLYVTFDKEEEPYGFNIEYSLRGESVPGVVTGTLNVNVMLKRKTN